MAAAPAVRDQAHGTRRRRIRQAGIRILQIIFRRGFAVEPEYRPVFVEKRSGVPAGPARALIRYRIKKVGNRLGLVTGVLEFALQENAGIGQSPLELRGLVLQVGQALAAPADAVVGLSCHPSPLACGLSKACVSGSGPDQKELSARQLATGAPSRPAPPAAAYPAAGAAPASPWPARHQVPGGRAVGVGRRPADHNGAGRVTCDMT